MKSFLVPLGNTESAVGTLQYAIDLAKETNATIYVIQVYKAMKKAGSIKNIDLILERDSKSDLEVLLDKVDTKGVEIKSKPVKGKILSSIQRVARQKDIDLVIMSARSEEASNEIFVGSITGGIIKHSDLPALIIPRGAAFKPPQKILFTYKSGRIERDGVLKPLIQLKSAFKSNVQLLHVIHADKEDEDEVLSEDMQQFGKENEIEAETDARAAMMELEKEEYDMLCVFRRRRGFFEKIWANNKIKRSELNLKIPMLVLQGK